ncbi:hypothetical protein FB45DRAFT_1082831 [Roridomyces roridus]|uniref:Uncharacterized protein n=1 Tax=Roridomyces roridus TaxID=1738132 RepID=A0AAD7FMQ4_9AGAR|nr:hypothetical protein FB45DRAFT_1082831 [Roridomyces roridus]
MYLGQQFYAYTGVSAARRLLPLDPMSQQCAQFQLGRRFHVAWPNAKISSWSFAEGYNTYRDFRVLAAGAEREDQRTPPERDQGNHQEYPRTEARSTNRTVPPTEPDETRHRHLKSALFRASRSSRKGISGVQSDKVLFCKIPVRRVTLTVVSRGLVRSAARITGRLAVILNSTGTSGPTRQTTRVLASETPICDSLGNTVTLAPYTAYVVGNGRKEGGAKSIPYLTGVTTPRLLGSEGVPQAPGRARVPEYPASICSSDGRRCDGVACSLRDSFWARVLERQADCCDRQTSSLEQETELPAILSVDAKRKTVAVTRGRGGKPRKPRRYLQQGAGHRWSLTGSNAAFTFGRKEEKEAPPRSQSGTGGSHSLLGTFVPDITWESTAKRLPFMMSRPPTHQGPKELLSAKPTNVGLSSKLDLADVRKSTAQSLDVRKSTARSYRNPMNLTTPRPNASGSPQLSPPSGGKVHEIPEPERKFGSAFGQHGARSNLNLKMIDGASIVAGMCRLHITAPYTIHRVLQRTSVDSFPGTLSHRAIFWEDSWDQGPAGFERERTFRFKVRQWPEPNRTLPALRLSTRMDVRGSTAQQLDKVELKKTSGRAHVQVHEIPEPERKFGSAFGQHGARSNLNLKMIDGASIVAGMCRLHITAPYTIHRVLQRTSVDSFPGTLSHRAIFWEDSWDQGPAGFERERTFRFKVRQWPEPNRTLPALRLSTRMDVRGSTAQQLDKVELKKTSGRAQCAAHSSVKKRFGRYGKSIYFRGARVHASSAHPEWGKCRAAMITGWARFGTRDTRRAEGNLEPCVRWRGDIVDPPPQLTVEDGRENGVVLGELGTNAGVRTSVHVPSMSRMGSDND